MRSFFTAIAFVVICGCAKAPYVNQHHPDDVPSTYMDLRSPIYVVVKKSFFSGCEINHADEEACRSHRISQINEGFRQWSDYFDKDARPRIVIVRSKKSLPAKLVNRPIYLRIEADFCGVDDTGRNYAACYRSSAHLALEIVFDNSSTINPRRMAHEIGHALGRKDHDVPAETGSVMSYTKRTPVLLSDVKMMCKLHHECRMVKRKYKKH